MRVVWAEGRWLTPETAPPACSGSRLREPNRDGGGLCVTRPLPEGPREGGREPRRGPGLGCEEPGIRDGAGKAGQGVQAEPTGPPGEDSVCQQAIPRETQITSPGLWQITR